MNRLRQWLGTALLAAVILGSLWRVLTVQRQLDPPGKIVIRVSFWQLEQGYREAFAQVAGEYERLHPNVKIVMLPVTEKLYSQWLNTHLVSGTAPDLAAIGRGKFSTLDQYTVRYFVPLGDVLDEPNPYNAGTNLAEVPWRETFLDGLRSTFQPSVQEYYAVPTSILGDRLYFNRTLLKEATGSDRLPSTFGQLITAADAIGELSRSRGQQISPIASNYSFWLFRRRLNVAFTAGFEPQLDTDLDGQISPLESYAGLTQGRVGMSSPAVRAFYESLREVCQRFPPGFASLDRTQTLFLFVQGRAGVLATGSWDARSLVRQSAGKFEIGIGDYPLPAPGERFAQYVVGRENESGLVAGAPLGLYKFSAHPNEALDFLQFLTSRKYNEMFNALADWPPVIRGARPSELMAPFMPDPTGYSSKVSFALGSFVEQTLYAQEARYLAGEISYEELAASVEEAIRNPRYGGDRFWAQEFDRAARQCRSDERALAVQSMLQLMGDGGTEAAERFRRVLVQQVRRNNGQEVRQRFEQVRGQAIPSL